MKRQKRILILGGSGRSASGAIRHLVVSDTVGEIGIAARNLDNLNRVAASAGRKVHPLQLDIADEPRLHSAVEHYDIVLNTAGPGNDLVLNATQAAIGAGKHYCDIAGDGPTVERQLELHVAARNRDVLVIPGMGTSPGLDNLLALHAYRQFDRTEELQLCHHVTAYVARMIAQLRNDGRVDATLQEVIGIMSRPARIFRDGDWIDVDPAKGKVAVDLPMGGQADAYPYSHSQTITLPRCLPDI
jgi:saccharopine dehydrogenase-like NADP-dependent oxidoreductase